MDLSRHDPDAPEFPVQETHGIALWSGNRFLVDSRALGWRDVYTSFAIEQPWRRKLPAAPHICFAYCYHGGAAISRRISGDLGTVSGDLRARLFGVVPEGRDSLWNLRGRPGVQLVYLRRRAVEALAGEAFGLAPDSVRIEPRLAFADPLLEQLAIELVGAAKAGVADKLYADQLSTLFALRVLRAHVARLSRVPPPADQSPRLTRVKDFIESALGEDLSLARLAEEAGVGTHAFAKAFQRATGVAPHRYVLERRLEKAKALLRARDLPLAEVALHCGFASQSHLTSTFRRFVGETPKQFRDG
jgi:AraC family transcriptional regulator